MKMGVALLRSALRDLDEAAFARAVHGTARALLVQLAAHAARTRSAARRKPGADGARDPWTVPDALWTAACRRWPHLHQYPLGECCERAFKKTVLDLVPPETDAAPAVEGAGAMAPQVSEKGAGDHALALFLRHCLFEICIDRLRRPEPFGRGYALSKNGRMVSLPKEAECRQKLRAQCDALAGGYLACVQGGASSGKLDDGKVGEAWESVVGVRPRRARARPGDSWVNVLAGPVAKKPAQVEPVFELAPRYTRLILHDNRYNVSCSFEPFEKYLRKPLRSRVKDLLDLGVAVFMSDLYVRREKELGRRVGLLLSVRQPDAWSPARDPIRRTVAHLGRDDFDVHFLKMRERLVDGPFEVRSDRRCVCLFSGGLDSAAGVAWALQQGLEPILVSHHATGPLCGIQKRVMEGFGRPIEHVGFHVAKRKRAPATVPLERRPLCPLREPPGSVMAQHLRSFLFLSAAAAVALEKGIRRVYVFENGALALNPLISEGRVNTQTAHPHVLDGFRDVIRRVFGVDLDIVNPFAHLTKGEVVAILKTAGLESLIAGTNSCWNWFNVPVRAPSLGVAWRGERHDGDCLPCVLRQAAVHAAGVAPGLDAPYLVDVFAAYPRLDPERLLAIADLLRFCWTVLALDDAALLRSVPELSVSVPGSDPRQLMAMLRRHAGEVCEVFRARANAEFRRDFAAVL